MKVDERTISRVVKEVVRESENKKIEEEVEKRAKKKVKKVVITVTISVILFFVSIAFLSNYSEATQKIVYGILFLLMVIPMLSLMVWGVYFIISTFVEDYYKEVKEKEYKKLREEGKNNV